MLALACSSGVLCSRTAGAVIGGATDGQSRFSVGVAVGSETDRKPHCSGTLISPHAVLTARHCVDKVPSTDVKCAEHEFGASSVAIASLWITTNVDVRPASSGWHPVKASLVPRTGRVCGDDIAILEIDDAVPADEAAPLELVASPADFRRETDARQIRGIGFGENDLSGAGAGVRRGTGTITIECVRGDTRFFCGDYLSNSVDGEMIGSGGPCAGDSGMAALTPGVTPRVLGVLARSTLNPARCEDGVYERTDRWAWFIAATLVDLARVHADTAPAWASVLFPAAGAQAPAGGFCRADAECKADAKCLSGDAERSFVCAPACDASGACADGLVCQGGACFSSSTPAPAPAPDGCACNTVRGRDPSGLALAVALGLVGALVGRRREAPT